MNHIKEQQFWSDTYKLKCGRAELLDRKLHNIDLSQAEHIIIGTGTNDIEKGLPASSIFANLIDTATKLSNSHKKTHVYIAQLPPFAGKEKIVDELNSMIKTNAPGNVHVILHENINASDLHDKKHIQIKKIGKLVKNMKDKMRAVIGDHTGRFPRNNREYRDDRQRKDTESQYEKYKPKNFHGQENPEIYLMKTLMQEFQKSNQEMLSDLKDSLLSSRR